MLLRTALASSLLLLVACGSDEPAAPEPTTPPAATSTPPAATSTPPARDSTSPPAAAPRTGFGPHNPTAAASATGVPECDNFIAKYEACLADNVPDEARGAMQTALETWRGTWRTMAGAPNLRASLEQSCRTAIDTARSQMDSYGCPL